MNKIGFFGLGFLAGAVCILLIMFALYEFERLSTLDHGGISVDNKTFHMDSVEVFFRGSIPDSARHYEYVRFVIVGERDSL